MTLPAALPASLRAAIARIARTPALLVACDYDGTLAPIVDNPTAAAPTPEAVAAVRALAGLPSTTVAVVSGRALRDLTALSRLPSEIRLVGSHGLEFDVGYVAQLPADRHARRAELHAALSAITNNQPGVRLEVKPASIAVHTRAAPRDVAARVISAVRSGATLWPDIKVTTGNEVVELAVVPTNKGAAVDALRMQMSASAVVFIGDDHTDEDAFASLHGPDVGIKVGPGPTRAPLRVSDAPQALQVLELLLQTRRRWLHGEAAVPIERHTMLSNGRTVALVTPDARVSWLCSPRPDSSAIFADLLGDHAAGHFSVAPERGGMPLGQRYRPGTMTVETRWSGLTVTDWLCFHSAGTSYQRVLSGSSRARLEFVPRPEFGQVPIRLRAEERGLLMHGSADPIALYSPGVEWEIHTDDFGDTARATVDLAALGGTVELELRLGSSNVDPPPVPATERQLATETRWRDWAAALKLPLTARDEVLRSALTLRGLWHEPTGSFLAAATCSLPEEINGSRNWDYRYSWLRDCALTATALVELGSAEEAEALLGWISRLVDATGGHPERLHPVYTVEGGDLGPEAVIDSLPGYAGSRPVRVGNAASGQIQLDMFGPVAELLVTLAEVRPPTGTDLELMRTLVEAVARRWHEPDHGVWQERTPPRHHVYSKVMCWMTVDRAIRLAGHAHHPVPQGWKDLRAEIAADVLEHGWMAEVGAFTTAYGVPDLDAASLWVGLSGLLADNDPRFLATVAAVDDALRKGCTVYRYLRDDGLPGGEGGFHLCTTWLVEAYLRTGRRADAEELFGQLLDCTGPTGLLSEQFDPEIERGLGNHPQASSHLGLIRCARLLSR